MTDHARNIATLTAYGDAPVLIFCDHASNALPDEYDCLGLPSDILQTHIAWDPGSAALGEALSRRLGASFLTCNFSRLLIDPNRDPAAPDLIPAIADQVPVPGNQMMAGAEREVRIARFHEPYHQRLCAAIEALAQRPNPLAVSVHSFTNRLMGAHEERPWGAGMLWKYDEPSARFMIDWLRDNAPWPIGDNEPYDARVFNYSVDRHIGPRGMRHLTFELRQDLLCDEAAIASIADLITNGISALNAAQSGVGEGEKTP